MRILLQRVKCASVSVEEEIIGSISKGYVLLLGTCEGDTEAEAAYLAQKVVQLRVFEDDDEKMNRSLLDICGEVLVVSQFTLYASCKKGRRPSFVKAQNPQEAIGLYNYFIEELKRLGVSNVQSGSFGAHMLVSINNDGPVTIMLDTAEIMPTQQWEDKQ